MPSQLQTKFSFSSVKSSLFRVVTFSSSIYEDLHTQKASSSCSHFSRFDTASSTATCPLELKRAHKTRSAGYGNGTGFNSTMPLEPSGLMTTGRKSKDQKQCEKSSNPFRKPTSKSARPKPEPGEKTREQLSRRTNERAVFSRT
jgi:hypothetical protein